MKQIIEWLKRAGNDIFHKRQYLEVYAALIFSIGFLLYETRGEVDQKIILSALLAILGIFAKTIIDIHWRNEDILSGISDRSLASRFFHWKDDLVEIERIIKRSSKICLWGYTLTTHIDYLENVLRQKAEQGKEIKILLLRPLGDALKMAAARTGKKRFGKKLEEKLNTDLIKIEGIKTDFPNGNFDFRVIDFLVPYTMYIYDDNLPQGKLMVRLSEFKAKDDKRTTYYLTAEDDKDFFDHHVKQFTEAWDISESWSSKDNSSNR